MAAHSTGECCWQVLPDGTRYRYVICKLIPDPLLPKEKAHEHEDTPTNES